MVHNVRQERREGRRKLSTSRNYFHPFSLMRCCWLCYHCFERQGMVPIYSSPSQTTPLMSDLLSYMATFQAWWGSLTRGGRPAEQPALACYMTIFLMATSCTFPHCTQPRLFSSSVKCRIFFSTEMSVEVLKFIFPRAIFHLVQLVQGTKISLSVTTC